MESGYDRAREDALLVSIDWPNDGYRLFEIGSMDESSVDGWFKPIAETNALFLRREFWEALGGLDERFDAPGGGLLNLDTYNRAIESPDAQLVVLLGEATFHQLHGGTNTNIPLLQQHDNWSVWGPQYASIRGRPYEIPSQKTRRRMSELSRGLCSRDSFAPPPSDWNSQRPHRNPVSLLIVPATLEGSNRSLWSNFRSHPRRHPGTRGYRWRKFELASGTSRGCRPVP